MKSKIKIISLFLLSLIYPYLLVDLMLDEAAPWNPIFNNWTFTQNNWVSLCVLILLFSGILNLGQSVFNEKKDETHFILKVIYKNVIGFSVLTFLWIFSIFMILLLKGSEISFYALIYIVIFPITFSTLYYLFIIKKEKNVFSYHFNIFLLFSGVVLPVIIYGLLAAIVI